METPGRCLLQFCQEERTGWKVFACGTRLVFRAYEYFNLISSDDRFQLATALPNVFICVAGLCEALLYRLFRCDPYIGKGEYGVRNLPDVRGLPLLTGRKRIAAIF
jgi:hypothetical protein